MFAATLAYACPNRNERDPPPLPRPVPNVLELSVSELHEPIPVPRMIRIVDIHPLLLDPVRHDGVRPREAVKEPPVGAGPKQRTCGSEPSPTARSCPRTRSGLPPPEATHSRTVARTTRGWNCRCWYSRSTASKSGVSERSASGGQSPFASPEKLRRTRRPCRSRNLFRTQKHRTSGGPYPSRSCRTPDRSGFGIRNRRGPDRI